MKPDGLHHQKVTSSFLRVMWLGITFYDFGLESHGTSRFELFSKKYTLFRSLRLS